MKPVWKYVICWALAVIFTLAAAVYQRMSGPTYPKRMQTELNGKTLKFALPRSHDTTHDCEVRIRTADENMDGVIYYKRYKTDDAWDTLHMQFADGALTAALPAQPAAGKLVYFVELSDGSSVARLDGEQMAVIRFKGPVPAYALMPHIIFMFLAMLLSNAVGLMALFRLKRMRLYAILTLICMALGGMIFGPIVQKFAFDAFWTGVPFGWDLTDNKTLIAFIAWIVAVALNWKKQRPVWIIIAAIVTIAIFSIPHSLFGSELDYATGAVGQG